MKKYDAGKRSKRVSSRERVLATMQQLTSEQLAVVVEAFSDAIFVIEAETRRILFVNSAVEWVLGYRVEEVQGKIFSTVAAEIAPEINEKEIALDAVLGPYRFLKRDGETCMIDVTVAVMPWQGTRAILYVMRDCSERVALEQERNRLIDELKTALGEVKRLSGLLPICANCKRVRDDEGYWEDVDQYLSTHSEAMITHGICPECMQKLYPELMKRNAQREDSASEKDATSSE